jgi:hypothetical protein
VHCITASIASALDQLLTDTTCSDRVVAAIQYRRYSPSSLSIPATLGGSGKHRSDHDDEPVDRLQVIGKIRAGSDTGLSALIGLAYGLTSILMCVCTGVHVGQVACSEQQATKPLRIGIRIQYGYDAFG